MSVVSSEVSPENPVQSQDVVDIARALGFHVDPEELDTLTVLLAAAHDTFQGLEGLPEFHLPVDRVRFPRQHVREPGPHEDASWAYRFTLSGCKPEHDKALLLRGKNIILKDNICVADVPQYNGTDAIEPSVPRADATIVTRILQAGGCIVGTATCEALSCATVSNTASRGPIHNPWASGYSAGGSSSGVAALLGGRPSSPTGDEESIDMGVGADQGGSIRVPAAFCGLVGLKATHGLIPYTGVITCEPVLDHVGPICKSVWEAALMLEVLAGQDGIDDRQTGAQRHGEISYSTDLRDWYVAAVSAHGRRSLTGTRIAVLREGIDAPFVKPGMKAEMQRVCDQLRALGCDVTDISLPAHETGRSIWMGICRQSLSSIALGSPACRRGYYPTQFTESLLPWSQEKWDKLPIGMRNELLNGEYQRQKHPHLYAKCMNLALSLTRQYEALFQTYDVLLLPATPFTAPQLYNRHTATPFEKISATFGQTLNTMQFNVTGHPALSLPTGFRRDMSGHDPSVRLPVSVQLVSGLHQDANLLRVGYAYEQAYDWKEGPEGDGTDG